jgi:hypothetical protein
VAVAIRHSGSGIVVMLEVTALLGVVVRVALGIVVVGVVVVVVAEIVVLAVVREMIVVAGEFEEVVEMVV